MAGSFGNTANERVCYKPHPVGDQKGALTLNRTDLKQNFATKNLS